MKTLFSTLAKIIAILLFAALVAGAFTLIVNNTSLASSAGFDRDGGQSPALNDASGQGFQPQARPEGFEGRGDHENASAAHGLAGIAGTLAKLGIIIAIVLLIEKAFNLVQKHQQPAVSN